ncbi:CAP-associated domain-containing protein [Bacillus tianshenii]|nr:CAP-associated domain-containing protein [Bacillus tianshenii]
MKCIRLFVVFALTASLLSFSPHTIEAKTIEHQENVPSTKDWKITFSTPLNQSTINKENIYVVDNSGQRVSEVEVKLSNSKKAIVVDCQEAYEPGETYTLVLSKNIASTSGSGLGERVKMNFTIQEKQQTAKQAQPKQEAQASEQNQAKQNKEAVASEQTAPQQEAFSIKGIEIGDSKQEVEAKLGQADRVTENQYELSWHTYHQNYKNFVMVAYMNDAVAGLYTNQDLIASKHNIKLKTSKQSVLNQFGKPMNSMKMSDGTYVRVSGENRGTYDLNNTYTTFYYDKHQNNQLTALSIISKKMMERKAGYYGKADQKLARAYEKQIFDLTNAVRVREGKSILTWSEKAAVSARKHSKDMAEKQYFSHTNKRGESPFDRMKNEGISYRFASENIAYGQPDSIAVHESWMNSQGHRKNILHDTPTHLGVGVTFNEQNVPYYAENFYTPY